MWVFYQKAQVCYTYLVDVGLTPSSDEFSAEFSRSRWFT